jgi:hypothetical protein
VRQGLEHAERALTSATREGPRDRLQAPSSERVPEAYRRLVEQYYRSLAKKGPQ